MVDNPQLLILSLPKKHPLKDENPRSELDAIYVPFRRQSEHIKELLNSLRCCATPVYLLPSNDFGISPIHTSRPSNTHVLQMEGTGFRCFFESLFTSRHRQTVRHCATWDLPIKRSFALSHAIAKRHQKILFIDDDIRIPNESWLTIGSNCLDDYAVAGCFVDNFIDTSVVGHLEREADEDVYSFLSGSFLFVRPSKAVGFFPCVYNEDWLFMLPHVLSGSICSFGSVSQIAFDPFKSTRKAVFQEFGEVVAEGLYSLVLSNEYERRFEFQMWHDVIAERREVLISLHHRLTGPRHRRVVAAALAVNRGILAEDCQRFVNDWEKDRASWSRYLGNLI